MNVLDSAKEKMRELTGKANEKSGPAGEKLDSAKTSVARGLKGANKYVDEKTGGKYSSTVHTTVDKAKGLFAKDGKRKD